MTVTGQRYHLPVHIRSQRTFIARIHASLAGPQGEFRSLPLPPKTFQRPEP